MQKRQNIELARIVSAVGIVFYHSEVRGQEYFYSALVLFVILSAYMTGNRQLVFGLTSILPRVKRLLIPWIFWFFTYGLANLVRQKPFFPASNHVVAGVLSGTSDHLWYMPFIFFCLISLDFIKTRIPGKIIGLSSALLGVFSLAAAPNWRDYSLSLGYPWAQYFHATPGFMIGIFLIYSTNLSRLINFLVFFSLILAAASVLPLHGVGITYLVGIFAAIFLVYCQDVR